MQPFGQFIMRSRQNACLLALVFAILPLLNWLSIIIVALVTLRRGVKEGTYVLVCALLPAIVWVVISKNQTILLNMVIGTMVVWLLAVTLHRTHNWSWVILIAVLLGMLVIVALHNYFSDINSWWQQKMSMYLQTAGTDVQMDVSVQQAMVAKLAKIATGLQAAAIFLIDMLWLVIARYWQALLYNPGKLRSELHNIRMPQWASIVLVLLVMFAWWSKLPMLIDMLPLVLVAYAVAGLSLVHFVLFARQAHWFWLIVLYTTLIFALPYMVVALVVIAICDSGLNIRRRYNLKQS